MNIKLNYKPLILITALPFVLAFGPLEGTPFERWPGGKLSGPVAGETISNFQFVDEQNICGLEVRPAFPHSVMLRCWSLDGELYVGCMSCQGKFWSHWINKDSSARIKIGQRVFPVLAKRLQDPAEMLAAWTARNTKYRPGTDVPVMPSHYWLWRLSSGSASPNGSPNVEVD